MLSHEQKQEIFTKVWNGMKHQGFRLSLGYHSRQVEGPMYRGRNGCKCNLGHLIPDEKYNPHFEGMAVEYLYEDAPPNDLQRELNEAVGFDSETAEDLQFFSELQSIHDDAASDWDVELGLRAFASENGFQLPNGEDPSPY